MAMQVLCVQVGRNQNLKAFAPHLVCKLLPDSLRRLRRDVLFLEAEIPVIGLYAVLLCEPLLDGDELVTGSRGVAVDSLNEKLPFRFFLVLCVGNHITERLILFLGVNRRRSLFGIGGVVDDLSEP